MAPYPYSTALSVARLSMNITDVNMTLIIDFTSWKMPRDISRGYRLISYQDARRHPLAKYLRRQTGTCTANFGQYFRQIVNSR
jgi:hypothetical protein